MLYTAKVIIMQVYDKVHTIFSSINFEANVQESKIWDITIVISEKLECSINVIFELNIPNYLR